MLQPPDLSLLQEDNLTFFQLLWLANITSFAEILKFKTFFKDKTFHIDNTKHEYGICMKKAILGVYDLGTFYNRYKEVKYTKKRVCDVGIDLWNINWVTS